MNLSEFIGFIFLLLIIAFMALMISVFPEHTLAYKKGVKDTYKEAFENGLMVKEISKDDEVIYRWIEMHKLNEDY